MAVGNKIQALNEIQKLKNVKEQGKRKNACFLDILDLPLSNTLWEVFRIKVEYWHGGPASDGYYFKPDKIYFQ